MLNDHNPVFSVDFRPVAMRFGQPQQFGNLGKLRCSISGNSAGAALPAIVCLPPSLVSTPVLPAIRGLLICRTAIPPLRIFGLEELLAAFQQATPRPRRSAGPLP